jgi:hypothetical protein
MPTSFAPSDRLRSSRGRVVRYASGPVEGQRTDETFKPAAPRYWSEYDNPESGDEDGGYFIYVNPDDEDETWIPFKNTWRAMYNGIRRRIWSRDQEEEEEQTVVAEAEPLLRPVLSASKSDMCGSTTDGYDSSTSSDDDDSDLDILMSSSSRRYGTLPVSAHASSSSADQSTAHDSVSRLIASMVSLFFASTLSVVLLVLSAVGRRRARGEIDVVVLVGGIISVSFAIAGLCGMAAGREAGLARGLVAAAVFGSVVIVDGLLIGRLVRDVQLERDLLLW